MTVELPWKKQTSLFSLLPLCETFQMNHEGGRGNMVAAVAFTALDGKGRWRRRGVHEPHQRMHGQHVDGGARGQRRRPSPVGSIAWPATTSAIIITKPHHVR